MSTYEILTIPHPSLKTVANPVGAVDGSVKKQMETMLETMYAARGIGLAANQVNILNRVLVMDVSDREEGEKAPICMANPEIVWRSEEMSSMDEGCLSIPGQYALVERPMAVKVRYWDVTGEEKLFEGEGLASHCVQHEIDHLNGILCIDYLSKLKRNMIVRKVEKMKRCGEL
ncbi:MAG: peptide deformylase [Alphaproteobacteria bacterium]|nr:peptide deformylase [Alphaproteobacteria bacterium]